VSFTANKDSQDKRERIYKKSLEKMGFKMMYFYKGEYFMAREGYILKIKEIKRLIESKYEN
jgi:hypothetical protein